MDVGYMFGITLYTSALTPEGCKEWGKRRATAAAAEATAVCRLDERYGNLHDNGDSAVPLASGRCLPSALLCRGVETNPHLTLYFIQVSLKKKYTAAMTACSIINVRSEVTVNETVCNSQASKKVTRPLMRGEADPKWRLRKVDRYCTGHLQ
jgi:hypothetical protein